MSRAGTNFPTESRNPEKLATRVKRDLIWVVISAAAAAAAAVLTYTLLPK